MFDFTRLTDAITGLIGGASAAGLAESSGAADLLRGAGIDPETLSGLGEAQFADLLAEHGLDPSQFSVTQLGELADQFGLGDVLSGAEEAGSDREV